MMRPGPRNKQNIDDFINDELDGLEQPQQSQSSKPQISSKPAFGAAKKPIMFAKPDKPMMMPTRSNNHGDDDVET
jgi:hypothetical protein